MATMLIQQCYLISNGMTTNECIRKKYPSDAFDEGCKRNWDKVWNKK